MPGPIQELPATNDFSPLEFLVGNCWVGTFADGKTTDEHCFEWKYGRKFIRDHHVVRGSDGGQVYEGETIYGWNPATKEITWRYVIIEGLMIDGTVNRQGEDIVIGCRRQLHLVLTPGYGPWPRTGRAGRLTWTPRR